ncbi:putative glutamate--tRNA ligase, cytoplasmic [Paramyrothecium foliicola]|nr:putative glutamate--tRNA ligase, cytoplasmic [Paramyrothecium foliicola]
MLKGPLAFEFLCGLYKPNHLTNSALVDAWIAQQSLFAQNNFQAAAENLSRLDLHLTIRTYIAGYDISPADLLLWGVLKSNHIALSLIKKTYKNVLRWYELIERSQTWIPNAVQRLMSPGAKARAAASASGASYEIHLPKIDGPMVTRFPPEPSGYLHIGHAKAALLNDFCAHQGPGGTLICRFDDTNPSKESMAFQDSITHDLKLMEIVPEKISFSSDYFQTMYEYALQLIGDGKAFADDSELGKGDEDRKNRLPSKRRELSIEEALSRFQEMKTGSQVGQRWCLRARIAYDSPNGTLRDPVIYRCNMTPHHRTGTKRKIYPTYDFCAPILDSIEGVTLALRTNEYRDRNVQYEWFQDALRLRKVQIWDFSRLNFIRTVLSKRKLTLIVDEGKVWGWDDPRMPTIRGIIRRGMTVPALREFILKQGPSRNVVNLEWGGFWALNKKYIDPITPRHTAIACKDVVACNVIGIDKPGTITIPKYQKSLELGTKTVVTGQVINIEQEDAVALALDEEITLKNWGNAFVRRIEKAHDGKTVTSVTLELHLQGDVKKTKKITWLAAKESNLVPVDLVSFDYLITSNKLEKSDSIQDFLAPVTEARIAAFADCNVRGLTPGAIIEFERKGNFILDVERSKEESKLVFFDIPSGKS